MIINSLYMWTRYADIIDVCLMIESDLMISNTVEYRDMSPGCMKQLCSVVGLLFNIYFL